MTKPAIEINNLSKSFVISHQKDIKKTSALGELINTLKKPLGGGGPGYTKETFWALDDVSFNVMPGEIFGVLGKNGSGKSTLLKILSRIIEPTRGSVKIHGRVASLLEVGTGFHPELTGRENIFLNGSMLGLSRREMVSKFNQIVEFSEVERFLDTPVKFYSSGMYVRLAFSVAAHLEPDVLILDEVLSVGDAAFQKKSLGKIKDVMNSGCTVLMVSHSASTIEELCTQAVWLDKGKVRRIGTTSELLDEYIEFSEQQAQEAKNEESYEIKTTTKGSITKFDLQKAKRVQGTGRIIFKELSVKNSISSKRELELTALLYNNSNRLFDNTRVSFSILNRSVSKKPLSILSNENVGQKINIKPGDNSVTLTIHNVPLLPGKYSVNCYIARDKTNQEVFDWVEDSAQFEIVPYDYYKTGDTPNYPGYVLNLDYSFDD